MSCMLYLPHCVGEVELTGTFRHITYVNINGVKWKWENATYFINSYISQTVCCLFVTEETDGVDLSVS